MAKKEKTPNPTWPNVRRLLKISGKQRTWLIVALACDTVLSVSLIVSNAVMRNAFDAVVAKQTQAFWIYALLMIAVGLFNIPFSYLKTSSIGRFSERTLAILRRLIAGRGADLPVAALEERHSGDLLSILNADLGKVKTLLANNLLDLYGQILRAILSFAFLMWLDWKLTLVATIITPAVFVLISIFTNPVAKRSEELQGEIGQVNSVAQDAMGGAMVVKAFNLDVILESRFHQANQKALKKGLGIARLWSLINGTALSMAIIPFIIAFGFGGYLVIAGQMTFGSLFAFINLLNPVVNPLGSVPNILASISEAAGAAQRVFGLLDQPAERQEGTVTLPRMGTASAVAFEDVSFAYNGSGPVLKHVQLHIPAGQTVAIVGPSGGGKSTLLKLLLGAYAPGQGAVCLLGEDLAHWELAAARQQMAFVAQDTYLFPVSIGENIRCGRLDATQAEVEEAARLANIHDFIASLPQGYQTPAGEWGARLSGGQKQRISLARAILKDAPILLLDEPTAALDSESEAAIQQALERFTRNRTTLVVAHRLSTIKNANRVVVLNDGEIVEEGTHAELIAKGGLYLDLYQRQFALDAPSQQALPAIPKALPAAQGGVL